MKTETYRLSVVFLTEVLGAQPSRDVATEHIAKRNGFVIPTDELDCLPDALERQTTVFHRDRNDSPCLVDYQLKGFLKEAGRRLNGKDGLPKNLRDKVGAFVFVTPRLLALHPPASANGNSIEALIDICERPLRAQTAQGPRIALVRSEMLPAGVSFTCGLTVIASEITEDVLRDLLDYGYYQGIGQWRNASHGQFRYDLVREE
jgi:hypothetical protein